MMGLWRAPAARGRRLRLCLCLCISLGMAGVLGGPAALAAGSDGVGQTSPDDAGTLIRFLSLDEIWELAETQHPSMRDALRELAALERTLQQREAAYAPSVTLRSEGLGIRIDQNGSAQGVNPSLAVSSGLKLPAGVQLSATVTARDLTRIADGANSPLQATLSLSYPLGRSAELDSDALALREARLALEAAERRLEATRAQARMQVLSALRDREVAAVRWRLAQEGLADALRRWEIVQAQAAAGMATEAQVVTAELERLRAEQELAVAERNYHTREQQLLRLLGLAGSGEPYRFESVWDWTGMPPAPSLAESAERAVRYSADVWERAQALETARLQLQAERERAGLDTSLQVSYSNTTSQGQGQDQIGWRINFQVSYPLFDGGQRKLGVVNREEAVARAEEALAAAIEQVRTNVEELAFQLEDARRQVEMAQLDVMRAELELAALERQLALPVPAATEDAVASARRARERAEIAWREAVWTYQSRWVELQILQGAVDWDALKAGSD